MHAAQLNYCVILVSLAFFCLFTNVIYSNVPPLAIKQPQQRIQQQPLANRQQAQKALEQESQAQQHREQLEELPQQQQQQQQKPSQQVAANRQQEQQGEREQKPEQASQHQQPNPLQNQQLPQQQTQQQTQQQQQSQKNENIKRQQRQQRQEQKQRQLEFFFQQQQQQRQRQNPKQQRQTQQQHQRRLEFVHIPKTGGSVLEAEAAKYNITWSICHFGKRHKVYEMSHNETLCPIPTNQDLGNGWPRRPILSLCPWWHVPPHHVKSYIQYEIQHEAASIIFNPYENADLFVTVRNVYDRILSEYYYEAIYVSKNKPSAREVNDPKRLHRWLYPKLVRLLTSNRNVTQQDNDNDPTKNEFYFRWSGHFIPQYDYVYERRTGRKLVQHVLRYETLQKDFDQLMKLYNLPIRFPSQRTVLSSSHIMPKELSVYNMTRTNLEMIELLYKNDFQEWGYPIMSKIIPQDILQQNEELYHHHQYQHPSNNNRTSTTT